MKFFLERSETQSPISKVAFRTVELFALVRADIHVPTFNAVEDSFTSEIIQSFTIASFVVEPKPEQEDEPESEKDQKIGIYIESNHTGLSSD